MRPIRYCIYMGVFLVMFLSCWKTSLKRSVPANDIIETSALVLARDSGLTNSWLNGMYVTLPGHYNLTTKNYPLLIFIHGAGQMGSSSGILLYCL